MKILKGFFWILLFTEIGDILSAIIPIAIPGPVYGLVLFFIALHFKWVPMGNVEELGTWLTSNMGIMFVPAGVGIINNLDVLGQYWWQIILILIVVTFTTMAANAKTTEAISKRRNNRKEVE